MNSYPAYISGVSLKTKEETITLTVNFTKFICKDNECVQEAKKFCLVSIPRTEENIDNCCKWLWNNDAGFKVTIDLESKEEFRRTNYSYNTYYGEGFEISDELPNRPLEGRYRK